MRKLFLGSVIFCALAVLNTVQVSADETESSVSPEIDVKLQQVVESQQQILKELEDIKAELQVLKVRVSQNQ